MKDAGHRDCIETALKHQSSDRTPVNNFSVVTAAHSAGVTVTEARNNPELSAKVAIDFAMKTQSDFVKPVIDSQIPFADLGMDVYFADDDYGMVKSTLIDDPDSMDEVAFFNPYAAEECPMFTNSILKALEYTELNLIEDQHICGLSWGPISFAGYLVGVEDMMMMALMEPDKVKKVIDKVTPFITEMEKAMIDAGASIMWMADPTSSEDLISPEMFADFSAQPIKKIIADVKKHADVDAYLHICGNTLETLEQLPALGVDCFSLDHAVDLRKAKEKSKGKMTLMGNIDPVGMVMHGNPEEIRAECYRMLEAAGDEGGYILAPGCETPLKAPDANVLTLGLSGRDYWKQ